jgi:hypothetical protein
MINRSPEMKSKTTVFVLALVVAASAFACSKSENKGQAAAEVKTCNKVKVTSKCEEYTSDALGFAEGACKELGGTYSSAPCPTEGRIGSCKKKNGESTHYYDSKSQIEYDGESAKEDCEGPISEGKFTAAAGKAAAPAAAAPPAKK